MLPSGTSVLGFSGFLTVLSSVKTSQIRCIDAFEIVIITNIIESIIRLDNICIP